jgi:hypothetical protein
MVIKANSIEWLAAIYERDFAAAITMLDSWTIGTIVSPRVYRPKSWFYGTTYALSGNDEAAAEWFHTARNEIEALVSQRPADLRLKITLADILANQDESEQAILLATQVLQALPTELDADLGPNFRLYAIKVFLAAGDHDTAIVELHAYLSSPAVWTIKGLLPDPRLDPIRDHPGFIELVQKFGSTEIQLARRRNSE